MLSGLLNGFSSWTLLLMAGLFECGFASTLKLTQNFTRFWPTLVFGVCITLSFTLLERSLRADPPIPVGTAYAVWTGIGAVGAAIIGMVVYKEPATFWRIFFLGTLVGSIVGLKMVSGHE